MKYLTAIAILLLIFCPAYGRHTHSLSKLSPSNMALTASQATDGTSETDADDDDGDDADNGESDNDSDGDDSDAENGDDDGSDDGETPDTDDEDTPDNDNGTDDENEDDNDGTNGQTTSAKTAIRNALRATALNRPTKPFATAAAALNTGLNAKETIAQLLAPAASESARSALALPKSSEVPATIASGVATGASAANLLSTDVPESSAFLLAVIGALVWICQRRR